MSGSRSERAASQRGAQAIALLYSIIFWFLIASGYFLLFQHNLLIALVAAVVMPSLAWWLAKFIGSSRSGIRGHAPLFALLLLISAMGVFNSLMLNLEGRRIFVETIDESHDRFDRLRNRAGAALADGGAKSPLAHMQRVQSLKEALFSEIRNPLNCGQGPEARKIVAALREELPDFRPLSASKVDCSRNANVVADYDARIDELAARATWADAPTMRIATDADAANKRLDALSKAAGESFVTTLLKEVAPKLESENALYRDLVERLPKGGDAAAGLPPRLDLRSVESLGEWSQLVYLIVDRLDRPTTWIYLLLSVFADWMMVHLFQLVRDNRARRGDGAAGGTPIGRGFA